jgi:hypothetical protein
MTGIVVDAIRLLKLASRAVGKALRKNVEECAEWKSA